MPKYELPTRNNRPLYPLKSGPSIPSGAGLRYFRRNKGTTDYISIPEITLSADFIIEFKALSFFTSAYLIASTTLPYRIFYSSLSNALTITSDNATSEFSGAFPLSVINDIKITMTSGVLDVFVNGLQFTKGLSNADNMPFIFNSIGSKWGAATGINNHKGVIYDVLIADSGAPVRYYSINDNGNTVRDNIGNQDGAVVSGSAGDWGLFNEQPDGNWKGSGLTVPPWDSVDQELIKA